MDSGKELLNNLMGNPFSKTALVHQYLSMPLSSEQAETLMDLLQRYLSVIAEPSTMTLYLADGKNGSTKFRRYAKLFLRGKNIDIDPFPDNGEIRGLARQAVDNNSILLLKNGKLFSLNRTSDFPEVRKTIALDGGEDRLLIPLMSSSAMKGFEKTLGLLDITGSNLLLGGHFFEAETNTLFTANLFSNMLYSHIIAQLDPMTMLQNRGTFDKKSVGLAEMFLECKQNTAIMLADLDGLKDINDTHGHIAGDNAIMHTSALLLSTSKNPDIKGGNGITSRYGGDEKVLMIPNADLEHGVKTAEKFVLMLRNAEVVTPSGKRIRVTVSVGVADFKTTYRILAGGIRVDGIDTTSKITPITLRDTALHLADKSMYGIKKDKKNGIGAVKIGKNGVEYSRVM
ncbi:GGDEF domain-containing protein [Candidatus Micrarchaeota archaeon]|nr:GGDEF domain-containing protein [Candidatus Micrarchaeota archaeon]